MAGVRRALVVGAGIGGLTTAIGLRRAGVNVAVLEQHLLPASRADDAFVLWHHTIHRLRELELDQQVIAAGSEIRFHEYRSDRGRRLARWAVDPHTSRLHAPAVVLARSALVAILTDALGEDRVVRGATCTAVEQDPTTAAAVLGDGSRHEADVLIGADGIDSTIRRNLRHGYDLPLRHASCTSWRATVNLPGQDVAPTGTFFNLWGRNGLRFRYCRLNTGDIYWEAVTADRVGATFDMLRHDKRGALSAAYEHWPWPVPQIIAVTPAQAITPNAVHRPSGNSQMWGSQRIVLVGDAAHPQTVDLSQSAGQAIEDAVLLSRLLTDTPGPVAALVEFERLRRPRVDALTRMVWGIGQLGQIHGRFACAARDALMRVLWNGWAQRNVYRLMAADPNA